MYPERLNIKAWAEEDRPREKLLNKGRNALSDAELIAILIGSGNRNETAVELSKRILASIENDLNKLGRMSIKELMQFKGIGEAKAISIAAALELGRRRKSTDAALKKNISSSKDAFDEMVGVMTDLSHEEFWVMYLDRRNAVIKKMNVSKGGVTGTVADSKIIFKEAIQLFFNVKRNNEFFNQNYFTGFLYCFLSIIIFAKISFKISDVPPPIGPNLLSLLNLANG